MENDFGNDARFGRLLAVSADGGVKSHCLPLLDTKDCLKFHIRAWPADPVMDLCRVLAGSGVYRLGRASDEDERA